MRLSTYFGLFLISFGAFVEADRVFVISNPVSCGGSASCSTCGKEGYGCGTNRECGTWAGEENVCCFLQSSPRDGCSRFSSSLRDISYSSGSDTVKTQNGETCDFKKEFLAFVSPGSGSSVGHCCALGRDSIVRITFSDDDDNTISSIGNSNDYTLDQAKCLSSLSNSQKPTTSTSENSSPTTSNTPNSGSRLQASAFLVALPAIASMLFF
ncbi:hypothetical protein TWF106_007360 [Orbilia oligospora]|uniref:Uncharacterized protein n=1 Tax=Orbilia oligospora TaxID=2813651 RepID=A0A6G1MCN1_ORBOL|nr:hypothetical protein TWF788_010958 [Orbilia oligospora]KAF3213446.1 hypothetical protein TWF679_005263 [Orbilia oligospora]KAF3228328.1 hypothetical protein TWF106_007360 [Orbilia oligospora]KAF3228589.1 hypothetical protein TWF191_002445 [Orbilia oligospora]KAF3252193.1 hypothetical protein TWF192_004646 [Orbilia oligospora]